MRKIFLTHVPMTTLPVALLRPVSECEDAVSFQLHFRLLFNFFCISSFLDFPKSIQQGSEISVFQFRVLWDHTVSIPTWHSYYNKTKEMEQGIQYLEIYTHNCTNFSVSLFIIIV